MVAKKLTRSQKLFHTKVEREADVARCLHGSIHASDFPRLSKLLHAGISEIRARRRYRRKVSFLCEGRRYQARQNGLGQIILETSDGIPLVASNLFKI